MRSLYFHVPFCFHKCHYCDFYSFVDTQDRQQPFVDRLERELAALGRLAGHPTLRTVFVGGGTPSLLKVDLWERLLAALRTHFDMSEFAASAADGADRYAGAEFTVECNPETVSEPLMASLRAGGVNRVSIGAQSFNPRHLKTLERWHDPDSVPRAVELARSAGIARQSIDLIHALPGQTEDEWAEDLDRVLSLGVTHVSCYTLTYEPGTALTARMRRGEIEPAGEDLEACLYEAAVSRLQSAGLSRYEISNFAASESDRSMHNLAYWRQEQWLAAGPSASGHLWRGGSMRGGSWRWKNVPRLGDYLSLDDNGLAPIAELETPDPARLLRERLMMGLRLEEGIDARDFLADTVAIAPDRVERLSEEITSLRDRGLLRSDVRGRWTLSERGLLVADDVAATLMRTLA
ncbi:MAG: radical SAM family heme chaperone HemW [Phycisphaeraceae bacterium]|nr:radical SAM family heme chaperone HemW [Phycisphaeraceae bacterium]